MRLPTSETIQRFFDKTLTGLLLSIAPFAASAIPVIFLVVNLIRHYEMPWYFALVIAIGAEGIGVGAVAIFFKAVQFNRRYASESNNVHTWPALAAYAIYLAAIIAANGFLESNTWVNAQGAWDQHNIIKSIVAALLSLLSLSGALLIATNNAINMVEEKLKRKSSPTATPQPATASAAPQPKAPRKRKPQPQPATTTSNRKRNQITIDNLTTAESAILQALQAQPQLSNAALGRVANISGYGAGLAKTRLIEAGLLSKNGTGKHDQK